MVSMFSVLIMLVSLLLANTLPFLTSPFIYRECLSKRLDMAKLIEATYFSARYFFYNQPGQYNSNYR